MFMFMFTETITLSESMNYSVFYKCLIFQHLGIMEARGNVTEYRILTFRDDSHTAIDCCNASAAILACSWQPSQHFIRCSSSVHSSYYVAVTAYTVAGCNSTLEYQPVFIPMQKQREKIISL